ncbi:hypothetical protein [Solicola gregarius]|uniref:SbsA Ig-like domain-containing protein n=1 Tax=Solicola gregarius TaxID=2908642 RepID=A0AA46TG73_9ACTN|nr:hypothetical protein [Solicola gregarius]UYM04777.1 hypothetical protein L0C25_19905 [Solicola gregarius]
MFKKSAFAAIAIATAATLTPSPSSAFIPRPYYPVSELDEASAKAFDPSETVSRITAASRSDVAQPRRSHRVTVVFDREVPAEPASPRGERRLDLRCAVAR